MWQKSLNLFTLVLILLLTGCAHSDHSNNPYRSTGYSPAYSSSSDYYSQAELDQLLAPIALYPDALLSQILMASTYPGEVEDAARWSAQTGLSGDVAVDAAENMNWDPSVKALTAFPDVLDRMADNMNWTAQLGDAYLSQEGEVFDAIQRLREHADRAGNLDRIDHLNVYRDRDIYIIEPATINRIYVPYYPLSIYGEWWWPDYPAYYWSAPRGYRSGLTFYWGSAIRVRPTLFYSNIHWHNRHIVVYDRKHHYRPYRGHNSGYDRYRDSRRWKPDMRRHRDASRNYRVRDHRERDYRGERGPGNFQRQRDQRLNGISDWDKRQRSASDNRYRHEQGKRENWQRNNSRYNPREPGINNHPEVGERARDRDNRPGQRSLERSGERRQGNIDTRGREDADRRETRRPVDVRPQRERNDQQDTVRTRQNRSYAPPREDRGAREGRYQQPVTNSREGIGSRDLSSQNRSTPPRPLSGGESGNDRRYRDNERGGTVTRAERASPRSDGRERRFESRRAERRQDTGRPRSRDQGNR